MLNLLFTGEYAIFILLVIALAIALTFHEWGHAYVAYRFGDDTAARAGRLTLNPLAHLDPLGLAMIVIVGFGYAKPVPTDPRNYRSPSAVMWVAAAGPFMNLVVAVVSWNVYLLLANNGVSPFDGQGASYFFSLLVTLNLLLMLFNLLPIGPLDGHYIMGHLLPSPTDRRFLIWNSRYGTFALLGLIALQLLGLPVFSTLVNFARTLMPLITFV